MSLLLASALMLQCFFDRPADGSVAPGDIPVVKLAVPAEYAESLTAKQPPLSHTSFSGEAGPAREWAFGNSRNPAAPSFQLLRVSLSEAVLPPSPYAARFGTVFRTEDGSYRFENKMSGYCKLLPADGVQQ